MSAKEIAVSGVWLRRIGDYAEVLVEIDGDWRLAIVERLDGFFSHIIEPSGMQSAPKWDPS